MILLKRHVLFHYNLEVIPIFLCFLCTFSFLSVHALNKLPYSKLDSKSVGVKDGVVFLTYSSLIASSERGRSRLQQLLQWCGSDFDGLVVFDEVKTCLCLSCEFIL